MATKTVNFSDSQIYVLARPERSGDAGPYGKWSYHGHSMYGKQRLYQGGTSDSSYQGPGIYNGLMMSALKLDAVHSTSNVNHAKITLQCYHTYNSTGATVNVWVGDNLPASGSTERDPGKLGFSKVTSVTAHKGSSVTFTLNASQCKKRYVIIYTNSYNNGTYYCYFGGAGYGTRPKVTIDYTDVIIPGKPNITYTPSNKGEIRCNVEGINGMSVFKGINPIEFYANQASNATETEIHLQWKDANRNWTYARGYPYKESGDARKTKNYGNSDRYVADGYYRQYWKVWSVARSKTGHTTSSTVYYFATNDLPTMNNSDLKADRTIAVNEINLSWTKFSDMLNNENAYYYRLWGRVLRNGVLEDYKILPGCNQFLNEFNKTLNLSDLGVNRGETIRIWIEPGDQLEWAETKYGYVEIKRNVIPYFPAGSAIKTSVDNTAYNNVFDGPINVTIPKAIDPDGQTITYKLYWRSPSQNTNWNYIATYNTLDVYNLDLSRYVSEGQSIQLGVIANDGLEDSSSVPGAASAIMKRNSAPSAPNQITIVSSTHLDNDDHYETVDYITWNDVLQFNGKPMNSYEIKYYGYKRNESNPYFTKTYTSKNNVCSTIEFGALARGDKFRFSVSAVDQYGKKSPAFYSNYYYKNSAPATPQNFVAVGSRLNFKGQITLTWDRSTDIDGDTIKYKLYFSKNRGAYEVIQNSISQNSYTHDISSLKPGDTLGYKIVAFDKYGVQSPEAYVRNNHELHINVPPKPMQYLLPNTNIIYANKPRIIFKAGASESNNLTIFVKVNGLSYSSSSSSSCFSKTIYKGGENVVFVPSTALKVGANLIEVKSFDGIDYSTEISATINYNDPTSTKISSNAIEFITAARYNAFKDMINSSIKAYGGNSLCSYTATRNQVIVFNTYYLDLYNKIQAINKELNDSYPGMNRYPEQYPSAKDNFVFKTVNNIIYDIITKI